MPNTPDNKKIISLATLSTFKNLLIQDFNGRYVPFSGADASVNLGANNFITSSYFEARSVSNDVINAYTRYRAGSVVVEDSSAQNTKIINFPTASNLENSNTFATQEWANSNLVKINDNINIVHAGSTAHGSVTVNSPTGIQSEAYARIRTYSETGEGGSGLYAFSELVLDGYTGTTRYRRDYIQVGDYKLNFPSLSADKTFATTDQLPDTSNFVIKNNAITGATKCKITYDSKGLVTGGADLSASDIPDLSGSYLSVTGGDLLGNLLMTGNNISGASNIGSNAFEFFNSDYATIHGGLYAAYDTDENDHIVSTATVLTAMENYRVGSHIATKGTFYRFKQKASGGTTVEDVATEQWVQNQGYTTNTGTVTSVTIGVGTGLAIDDASAITTSGTRTISIASGYKLPTISEWNAKANTGDLGRAAYKDFTTSITAGSDALITSGAVALAISSIPTPMQFKGTLGTGGTITSLPDAFSSNGYTYKVITDGTYITGENAKVGDVYVSNGRNWVLIPSGDDVEDTWRAINVNGTAFKNNGISSGAVNFVAGSNITISTNGNDIIISSSSNADTLDGHDSSYFATASALSSYLPLAGGAMSGIISRDAGGSWINARDHVVVKTTRTSSAGNDWHPVVGGKTSLGFWSLGSVGGETLMFSYDTDSDYENNYNKSIVLNIPVTDGGTLATREWVNSQGFVIGGPYLPISSFSSYVNDITKNPTLPKNSPRDFTNGTLVTTDIDYSHTEGAAFYMEIKGDMYGNGRMFTQVNGYIYRDTIINYGVNNLSDLNITQLIAMNIDGRLCFWWPRLGYWQSFSVEVYTSSNGDYHTNHVISITDSSDVTTATKRIDLATNLINAINTSNIGSQSVNYASSAGNADTVDGEHASAFAHNGTANNLIMAGNEFNFIPSSFTPDTVWFNYRTTSGYDATGITTYNLGDGKGGLLGTIIHTGNIGSQSVNYANSAGSVAWSNVSNRPTALSQFTNDAGYITSSALNSYLPLSGGSMTGPIQFGDWQHRISQEDGSTITRAGGGTIALPVGSGTKGMAILVDEGGDFGLLYIGSDGAVVANSGDNGYVFKVYDKDMNSSDFTSGTGFLLGVKQGGAGTAIAGDLEVGSVIYEGGYALSDKYLGKTAKATDSDLLDGHDSSYFYPASNPNGYTTLTLVSSGGNNGSATTAARSDHTHAVAVAETLDSNEVPVSGTGSSGFMSAHDKTTIDRLENGFWHGGEWDWPSFSIIDLNQGSIFRRKTVNQPTYTVYETNFMFPQANSNSIETLATQEWVSGQGYTTDSVSGVNDGTNWTSITINGVTKNIPSGGSGSLTLDDVSDGTTRKLNQVTVLTGKAKLGVLVAGVKPHQIGDGYLELSDSSVAHGTTTYFRDKIIYGNNTLTLPTSAGTLALTSNIKHLYKHWVIFNVYSDISFKFEFYSTSTTSSSTLTAANLLQMLQGKIVGAVNNNSGSSVMLSVHQAIQANTYQGFIYYVGGSYVEFYPFAVNVTYVTIEDSGYEEV